jgi:hypothetical protein
MVNSSLENNYYLKYHKLNDSICADDLRTGNLNDLRDNKHKSISVS